MQICPCESSFGSLTVIIEPRSLLVQVPGFESRLGAAMALWYRRMLDFSSKLSGLVPHSSLLEDC